MRIVQYEGYPVEQVDDCCFEGWKEIDKENPVWQTEDGKNIPLKIMVDDHLVACYRMVNERLEKYLEENKVLADIFKFWPDSVVETLKILEKWEEVLFQEANNRGLVVKLYD